MPKKQNKKAGSKNPGQKNKKEKTVSKTTAEETPKAATGVAIIVTEETDEEKELSPRTIEGILEEEENFEESMDIADDDAEEESGDWE